ncbi:hypothetical protein SHKM778_15690 [Streptomyces sp. KM77-8]|uniref:Ribonucleoside-diphosphate reductase n=1 Tax=Streptomyces haneummycinicus TaxID=3074435 RepID=A0AAT9HCQ4_9ACTN
MTIAPADPVSAIGVTEESDGPGAALLRTLTELTADLPDADPGRVAAAALRGRSAAADLAELRELATEAAAGLISEDPAYSRLAARLLTLGIRAEAASQGVTSFTGSVATGHREGLIADRTAAFVGRHADRLDALIDPGADDRFGYFGLRTLHSRYLLRHPVTRKVVETPQHFLLRVAAGLAEDDTARSVDEVAALYALMSRLDYLPSSPTLFNSGTRHPQMSSCYLLDSPLDELDSIYDRYHQVARLSKHAGGIGLSYSRIRSRGSLIRGTNGHSNGIVPFLKTLDASVAAVNQGGRRKGAAAVYLETWHSDIEEFLELRDNTGEDARRTHNLNLAHWVPDEFMRRVNADAPWSLFSPADVPELVDLWGGKFDAAYRAAEAKGLARKTLPARELYGRMMRTLAQTGNGWMTFKDAANRTANQTATPGHVVHSSNLCTEILEVTDDGETAVCNLGSVNLGAFVTGGDIDWERLDETVRTAVTFLDRVVDINYYPTEQAGRSNARWRPVGLGAMGLQDVFFRLRMPFDSPRRRRCPRRSPSGSCSPRTRPPRISPSGAARCPRGSGPAPRGACCTPTTTTRTSSGRSAGRRCASGSPPWGCATRCSWRSRPPPPSRPSRACTSASSRRCPTCSSARRCPGSSSRSTRIWWTISSGWAYGTRARVRRCARPTARCRTSPGSPRTYGGCTARRGRSRSAV